jgi:uncharacterized protein YgbK (DUF1537 family)
MMVKLLISADDFTGALDTGVQLAERGISVRVISLSRLPEDIRSVDCETLVVNTDSRHLPPEEAGSLIEKLVRKGMESHIEYFYKKTDSALRGNIGAELAGLLQADDSGFAGLTFVPAYPENRRTTLQGIVYIDGVELADSIFSEDPFSPVRHSAVKDIIREQSDLAVATISQDGYEMLAEPFAEKSVRVADAQTEADISHIGKILKGTANMQFLAGCAGFARVLPDILPVSFHEWEVVNNERENKLLIVAGSINRITVEQTDRGEELGYPSFILTPEQKLNHIYPDTPAGEAFINEAAAALRRRGRAMIRSVKQSCEVDDAREYARRHAIADAAMRNMIAENIATLAIRIAAKAGDTALAVFGGDTLHSILEGLDCTWVTPMEQISVGIVATYIHTCEGDRLLLTKSGGLGGKDALKEIDAYMYKEREMSTDEDF